MLTFILSTPRSGSTVLTALLEKKKGIICMPESSFPQVLGSLNQKERLDTRWLAALYIAVTFPPTPITLDEAEECMKGSDEDILINLGKALAKHLRRPVEDVSEIIWKTTRTIGMHKGPLLTNGKFVIIHRNPLNVFESQFRVSFGQGNRNPLRFAIFNESYEHAFRRLPSERKFELNYDDLPGGLVALMDFLKIPDLGEWQKGESAMAAVANRCSWLTQITKEFENTDLEKRNRLDPMKAAKVKRAMQLARPFRPLLGPVRSYFDQSSVDSIVNRAKTLLLKNTHSDTQSC